mmetsp:Transcript_14436/g.19570  ORF Transcript_14436/g.19570 Transcript_14436/m.19570 type:complete len:305 (+) Transcript_14436:1002-1916(+)
MHLDLPLEGGAAGRDANDRSVHLVRRVISEVNDEGIHSCCGRLKGLNFHEGRVLFFGHIEVRLEKVGSAAVARGIVLKAEREILLHAVLLIGEFEHHSIVFILTDVLESHVVIFDGTIENLMSLSSLIGVLGSDDFDLEECSTLRGDLGADKELTGIELVSLLVILRSRVAQFVRRDLDPGLVGTHAVDLVCHASADLESEQLLLDSCGVVSRDHISVAGVHAASGVGAVNRGGAGEVARRPLQVLAQTGHGGSLAHHLGVEAIVLGGSVRHQASVAVSDVLCAGTCHSVVVLHDAHGIEHGVL